MITTVTDKSNLAVFHFSKNIISVPLTKYYIRKSKMQAVLLKIVYKLTTGCQYVGHLPTSV